MLKKILIGILALAGLNSIAFTQSPPVFPIDYFQLYDADAALVAVQFGDPLNPTETLYMPFGMGSPYGFPWAGVGSNQENEPNGLDVPASGDRDDQETLGNSAAGEEDYSLSQFAMDIHNALTEMEAEDAIDAYIDDVKYLDDYTSTDRLSFPYDVDDLLLLTSSENGCTINSSLPQSAPFGSIFDNYYLETNWFNPNQNAPSLRIFEGGVCPGSSCFGILPGGNSSWGGAVNCPLHITDTPYTVTYTVEYDDLDIRYRKAIALFFKQRKAIRHQFWLDVNAAVSTQDWDDLIDDNIYYRGLAEDDLYDGILDAWNYLNP